jgi:hydrogenase maturation protease
VLGVGSTLRRDDALGLAVVDALEATPLPAGVAARSVHGLVPELAADLAEVDAVWFVDAAADAALARPTWARVDATAAAPGVGGGHALDPAALLAWTEAWAGRAPEAWTLALPADDLGFGEGWSPRGARSLATAVRDLRRRWGVDART